MAQPHTTPQTDTYAGPSKNVVTAGRGYLASWTGSIVGAAVAVTGAVFSPQFGEYISKHSANIEQWSKKLKTRVLGEKAAANTNLAYIFGIGAVGWIVGHYVGMALGFKKGRDEAPAGEEQFERLKNQRDQAKSELAEVKQEIGALNAHTNSGAFADKFKPAHGTHTERAAEKTETTEIAR